MDVLRHKSFGGSTVYDKDFFRQDKRGGFGANNVRNLAERGGCGGGVDKIWLFAELA